MASEKTSKTREPGAVAEQSAPKTKSTFREYAEAIGMALLLALFIRTFIVQAFKIPSGSMIPTLEIGDHILVNKLAYGVRIPFWENYLVEFQKPRRGDVIVFIFPEDRSKDFIKRVIAVGGETVEIRQKKVYVDGKAIADTHAYFKDGELAGEIQAGQNNFGPRTVPENHIFVMGDNRDSSHDSRFWGFVSMDEVRGKAFLIYWSWDGSDRWVRWERLGNLIR
jgi:signal peptidase I